MNVIAAKCSIIDSVTYYGEDGDQTLEYVGLVFEQSKLYQIKIYHTLKSGIDSATEWKKILWKEWLQDLSEKYPIKICDTSKVEKDSFLTYRMIVKFIFPLDSHQTNTLITQHLPRIPEATKERFLLFCKNVDMVMKMPYSSLMQIGIETDEKYSYRSIKYYLSIKSSIMVKQKITNSLTKLIYDMQYGSNIEDIQTVLTKVQEAEYSPSFIGVNDTGEELETKLYFVSNLFGRSLVTKTKLQIDNICQALNIEHKSHEMLKELLQEERLYPEGIAVSFGSQPYIRFYLKQISSRYFK